MTENKGRKELLIATMTLSRTFNKVVILLVAALLMSVTLFIQNVRAATGTIYLSPASASVLNGNTFTSDIRVNPGTAVDTVDVTLGFDSSKVTYQSITYAGSPFTTQIGFSQSTNSLHFTSGNLGGSVTTDSFIATVTFKAVAGSGTTSLTTTGSNAAYAGNPTGPATAGATITLTSPVATCPAGQTGTPPNCVTPTTPPPTPTPTTPKPTTQTSGGGTKSPIPTTPTPVTTANADYATTVGDTKIQYTQATFTVTSKAPTEVYIRYGLAAENMTVQTPVSPSATTHTIALDPAMLLPGQMYYYQVFSKGANGQTLQAEVASFTTNGVTIKVGFFDKNKKPLANKKVTIHSSPQTATTDSKGFATFSAMSPGAHTVSYVKGNKTYSRPITVENNIQTEGGEQTSDTQTFSVVLDFAQGGLLSPLGLSLLGVAVVVIVAVALYLKRKGDGFGDYGDYIPTLSPVTVGGESTAAPEKPAADKVLTEHLEATPMPQSSAPGTVIAFDKSKETEEK